MAEIHIRDQTVRTYADAVEGIESGMTVMVGGFGAAGIPLGLLAATQARGITGLTVISNNAGFSGNDLTTWFEAGMVAHVVCSYPRTSPTCVRLWREGRLGITVVPQGTLVERMRAAGAGLGGIYSPTGVGTLLAEGKETKVIGGKEYVLELPLHADVALIQAAEADPFGNLSFNKTARNFAPAMATAATLVVAETRRLVPTGTLDPERIVTPGIFVDRVVSMDAPAR